MLASDQLPVHVCFHAIFFMTGSLLAGNKHTLYTRLLVPHCSQKANSSANEQALKCDLRLQWCCEAGWKINDQNVTLITAFLENGMEPGSWYRLPLALPKPMCKSPTHPPLFNGMGMGSITHEIWEVPLSHATETSTPH